MFDIRQLFAAPAFQRMLQPAQDTTGVQNMLMAAAQQPEQRSQNMLTRDMGVAPGSIQAGADPWAGMRQPAVDPASTASTGGNGLPATAAMGTIMRGADGKNYQFAETGGMQGAKGNSGWIETSMSPTQSAQQGAGQEFISPFYDGPPDAGVRPTGATGRTLSDVISGIGTGQQTAQQPGQAQTAGQRSSGGILDRLRSGINKEALNDIFAGWAAGGNDWQKSLALGGVMASKGKAARGDMAGNVKWLMDRGYNENDAKLIAGNQSVFQDVLKNYTTPQDPMKALNLEKTRLEIDNMRNPQEKPTDDIKEYQYAVQSGQFKGSFTDWQTKGVKDQDATFGREQGIRKEYTGTPEYKRFDDVRSSYERLRASAKRESGAGDLGVIFGFMKMLDPGSVVREGEFANAENTAGVPDRIRNLYNRVISGERLNESQRKEFIDTAGDLYGAEAERINGLNERYSAIAGQYQLDPSRIIVQPQQYDPMSTQGDPLDEARKAIAAGADENAVRQRLQENGIDPSGL